MDDVLVIICVWVGSGSLDWNLHGLDRDGKIRWQPSGLPPTIPTIPIIYARC